MTDAQIVVVEDEEDIQELLVYNLRRHGFEVLAASDGASGLALIRSTTPDLVLLDLMLPDINGLEICEQIRRDGALKNTGVIMVTARDADEDIVRGLALGADDYIPKPFSNLELLARVRAVLRRIQRVADVELSQVELTCGFLRINSELRRAWLREEELGLTATEFRMLLLLASNPGRIFSRSQMLSDARGELAAAFDRTVDAHVRTIRKKLGPERTLIETVRSFGYRFRDRPAGGGS